MSLPPNEDLTTIMRDGVWHAIYPSAEATLCSLRPTQLERRRKGRRRPPSCRTCVHVVRRWQYLRSEDSHLTRSLHVGVPDWWGPIQLRKAS